MAHSSPAHGDSSPTGSLAQDPPAPQEPNRGRSPTVTRMHNASQEHSTAPPATQDLKTAMPLQSSHSARTSDRRLYDPEKLSLPNSHHDAHGMEDDAQRLAAQRQAAMRGLKKDLGALVNFMTITPFISFAIAFYTFFAFFVILIFAPLNLCFRNRSPVGQQLRAALLPATNLHYKAAWSASRGTQTNVQRSWPGSITSSASLESGLEDQTPTRTMDPPSNAAVIIVHLLSPLLSMPLFFAAVVVVLWWIMSAITANDTADGFNNERPRKEGQGGFDEGQRLARGLRMRWVGWISGNLFR